MMDSGCWYNFSDDVDDVDNDDLVVMAMMIIIMMMLMNIINYVVCVDDVKNDSSKYTPY